MATVPTIWTQIEFRLSDVRGGVRPYCSIALGTGGPSKRRAISDDEDTMPCTIYPHSYSCIFVNVYSGMVFAFTNYPQ